MSTWIARENLQEVAFAVGLRIRKERLKLRMSQKQFSKLIGVSATAISMAETATLWSGRVIEGVSTTIGEDVDTFIYDAYDMLYKLNI